MNIENMNRYTPNNYPEYLQRNGDHCHLSQGMIVWNTATMTVDLILGKICQDDYVALTLETGMTDMDSLKPFDPVAIDINLVKCNANLKSEILEILEDQEELVNQVKNSLENGDETLIYEIINNLNTRTIKEII